ncbi:NinE family protein [Salmonella enterica subsp. enterica]|nr:NinE family protein [Salmonella enterica subsp. enterica]
MARQRRSITDIICENCKRTTNGNARNKPKPIPKRIDVKTFNYTAHLWDIRWLREHFEENKWICPYISRHLLSLNPLLACCRRYSRGER